MPLTILYYKIKNNNYWNNILVSTSIFFFFSTSLFSQVNPSATEQYPLLEILTQLEEKFQLRFTYADETIEDILVQNIPKEYSLDEIIAFIQEKTALTFTKIDENFISINKKSNSTFISGIIKERGSDLVLEGVHITGENNSTITNQKGYFELEIFNNQELIVIDYLGYQTVYQRSDFFTKNNVAIIYLDQNVETLTEVVLKNYITKGIDKIDDGSYRVTFKNSDILPGLIEADVLQTIQALPGIQSVDETVSNINIRGGSHDQNLILWDGIKMYQSGHFFGLISTFNPTITKNAILIKNGSGAEYSDGISGTIIMNTDPNTNTRIKGSIGTNMINADGFIDIPTSKNSSLQLSSRKAISNLVKTPTYSQYFDRITQDSEIGSNNETDLAFDFYDINARWHLNISDKDKLRLNFLTMNNELVFTENAVINNMRMSRQSNLNQSSIVGGIWYQRNWSDRFNTSFQAYETDYKLKSINANLEFDQRFLQENIVSETGIKLHTNYKLKESIAWKNGYQFIETGVTNLNDIDSPLFRENRIDVIRTHSLFSEIKYKGTNKLNYLNFGLKYTYNDKFKTHIIEPRLSYNQKFLTHFNLEILGEFKHQNSSQIINFQNDFLGIEKRRWVLANNEDIPVIESKQISLGLSYKENGLLISVEGYYKNVEGITARSQGFQNKYEFRKAIGSYDVSGLDVLLNKRFNDLSTWVSYSLVNNNYTFETFEEKNFSNNNEIIHSFTLGTSYTLKNLKIAAGLNWHSGLPTTRPNAINTVVDNTINYEPVNSSRLKEYLRLDISATYSFNITKSIKANTGFSLWNLSNRNNVISNYYRLNQNNQPQEFVRYSLGITPNATFKLSF